MIESKSIYITLFLITFCICNGMGSPMADPDPGVKVNVNVNVNDKGGSQVNDKGDSQGGCLCSVKDCNEDCKHWCYPSTNWPFTCAAGTTPLGYCGGSMQSPIDISTSSAQPKIGALTFSPSYSVPISTITIKNNGHTVGASWADNEPARTISGGGLTGDYTLAQFHFHWGCYNNRGSEHVVDGTRYAMELHLVHYKTSYGSLAEAIKFTDGLAVLGVFFNVGAANAALVPITVNLPLVIIPSPPLASGDTIVFNKALLDFIPTTRTFYRYQGSLTTPTCNEVVTWSVFSSHLTFSNHQADEFRKLHDKQGCMMGDNYRGIQPLNGRVVEKYN